MQATAQPQPPVAHAAACQSEPQRLDLYQPIHQALRSGMARSLVALGALDLDDADECRAVLGGARQLLGLIDSHLQHEEVFVHPLLQALDAGLVDHAEAEHQQHRTASAMLRAEIDALAAVPSPAAALGLYRRFALFVADHHEHMHMEETQLNGLLWAGHSDAQLQAVHSRLLASLPPEELAATLPLMLPALTPQQRAGMLGAMRAEAPPPVLRQALDIAEAALDRSGWRKLCLALGLPLAPGCSA